MTAKSIFIAATGQNVGKTTVSLGIFAGLKKRLGRVGFLKPVGQQHVEVEPRICVDKDVILIKKHFNLDTPWQQMSPVMIPAGFTRSFLDGHENQILLKEKITVSYRALCEQNDFVLIEGTGHVGVGSILGMNNARIAKQLGAEILIVASGGLGSSIDELALNIALCREIGVKIKGVILNRVLEDKKEMILEYFPKALAMWGIPLLGMLPYTELLNSPAIRDFENLFHTPVITGEKYRERHFANIRLVAGSLEDYYLEEVPNQLVITPACREDIIEAVMAQHTKMQRGHNINLEGGIILTGNTPPSDHLLTKLKAVEIPTLYARMCSFEAMKKIATFTAKIRVEDTLKVQGAIALIEEHLNFDLLCESVNNIC